MIRGAIAAVTCGAILFSAASHAAEKEIRFSPSEIAARAKGTAGPGTSGVAGIRTTILNGDPTMPGPYTIEIRVPPHTKIEAHTHRDERSAVVVSGRWFFGYGPKFAKGQLKPLPPGSFYTEPAGHVPLCDDRGRACGGLHHRPGPTDTRFTQSH